MKFSVGFAWIKTLKNEFFLKISEVYISCIFFPKNLCSKSCLVTLKNIFIAIKRNDDIFYESRFRQNNSFISSHRNIFIIKYASNFLNQVTEKNKRYKLMTLFQINYLKMIFIIMCIKVNY